jgi:hypothetical protein
MTRIAGLAPALGLGLMLLAVHAWPAAAGQGAQDPYSEPRIGVPSSGDERLADASAGSGAPVFVAGAVPQSAPISPALSLTEFLQCRVGCGPKCETTGDAEQMEHCKQRCERKCHAPDGQ